uniref:Putative ovule protein n=1 Tax=Solanum chacoense TaxID=4108 RepID=A0A0V0HR04_SOLCH
MCDSTNSTATLVVQTGNGSTIDTHHPYHLHFLDSPGMNLITSIFDGRGFPRWRRFILIALSAKKKLGFINGVCKAPDLGVADYD